MKRREFVSWIGAGVIATSLPVALAACNSSPDPATENSADSPADDTSADASNFVVVGTVADLAEQGYLTNTDALGEPIIVIQDPQNSNSLIALSSKCTHKQCDVAWQEDLFACPCHGSKFNPDGSVVNGPATEPLKSYTARIEGDSVVAATA